MFPQEEYKIYIHTKSACKCSEALFVIAKDLKQAKCPLSSEPINKLWNVHIMEYYSAVNRSKPLTHTTWMNITCICERSQPQKATYCMIPFTWHSSKEKIIGTDNKPVVARAWEKGLADYKGAVREDWGGELTYSASWLWEQIPNSTYLSKLEELYTTVTFTMYIKKKKNQPRYRGNSKCWT